MNLSENEILEIFEKTGALFNGHFLLASGRHSDVYFQCAKVLQYSDYIKELCSIIADEYCDKKINTVIAPAIGGLVVGQEVARQLHKRFIFAEREDNKLTLRRGFSINEGEKVLVCEDVVTTGGSVFEIMDIVKDNNAEVAGVGFIVDRSNGKVDFGCTKLSAVKLDVKSYLQEECPLCEQGIELIKPGSRKIKTD
ncbi:MAG: orotate phosphoribosyltransferase [Bacteroidetes bacterium]|nr:orotate phosphoribosyltransferase [Bacteroidota bacterium]